MRYFYVLRYAPQVKTGIVMLLSGKQRLDIDKIPGGKIKIA